MAGVEPAPKEAQNEELRTLLKAKGIPLDYRSKPIQGALRGVTKKDFHKMHAEHSPKGQTELQWTSAINT
jgi:hypothetical protein